MHGLIWIGIGIASLFWIWMLIDCASRKFKNDSDKIVWVLIILFSSFIGAFIYYAFCGEKIEERKKSEKDIKEGKKSSFWDD